MKTENNPPPRRRGSSHTASPSVDAFASTEAYCTSGTSPTVHLVGVGQVGRALLELLRGQPFRLVAVTDSSATLLRRDWLDPAGVAEHKRRGGRLAELPGAESVQSHVAVDVVDADVVVDATPTHSRNVAAVTNFVDATLRRGGRVAMASKAALCANIERWFEPRSRERIGIDAVLGGAGSALSRELEDLRAQTVAVALCGSASTTMILECIESGGSLEAGLNAARVAGCLESDPELDLRGEDAATKLAILVGALTGCAVDPKSIPRPDLRDVNASAIRARVRAGATTRLVGRFDCVTAKPTLAFEELSRSDVLVAPPDRVVYGYRAGTGATRVHVGHGVGPVGTATALLGDLHTLCGEGGAA